MNEKKKIIPASGKTEIVPVSTVGGDVALNPAPGDTIIQGSGDRLHLVMVNRDCPDKFITAVFVQAVKKRDEKGFLGGRNGFQYRVILVLRGNPGQPDIKSDTEKIQARLEETSVNLYGDSFLLNPMDEGALEEFLTKAGIHAREALPLKTYDTHDIDHTVKVPFASCDRAKEALDILCSKGLITENVRQVSKRFCDIVARANSNDEIADIIARGVLPGGSRRQLSSGEMSI